MNEDERKETALASLRKAHLALQDASAEITQRVVGARVAGATWAKIAGEVGMLQPNAVRKYKPLLAEGVVVGGRNSVEALKALADLRQAHVAGHEAEQLVVQRVAECRNASVTWEEIAVQLDALQPNVVIKYKPLLVEHRTVTVRAPETAPNGRPAKA